MKRLISCLSVFCLTVLFIGAGSVWADDKKPYAGETINVYNWGEYISDGSDGLMDINAEFSKETGIKVNYSTYENQDGGQRGDAGPLLFGRRSDDTG